MNRDPQMDIVISFLSIQKLSQTTVSETNWLLFQFFMYFMSLKDCLIK